MKKLFLSVILSAAIFTGFAQNPGYKQAIGVKLMNSFTLTYKNFIRNTHAIEGQLSVWNEGYRASGMYEFQFNIKELDGLSWFIGPGVHAGFWNEDYKGKHENNVDLGVDGIIGLDYKFKNIPLNLSLDWQPAISVVGDGFYGTSGGIGVRYTF